jgi:hypothetical protein
MIQPLTLRDHDTGKIVKRRVDCVTTPRNDCYPERRSAEAPTFIEYTLAAPPTISPTGVFGTRCGLHSLIVSPVGATYETTDQDTKPPRNENDKGEDWEETGESVGKAQAHACMYIKIDQRTCSPHGMIGGLLRLGAVLSFPPSPLTSIFDIST